MGLSIIGERPFALVVCEKPDAARRIAQVLGTSSLKKISALEIGVKGNMRPVPPVFSVTAKDGLHFVVCSGLGHLYGLVDIKGNRHMYPVFDIRWLPISNKTRWVGPNKISLEYKQIIKTISLLSQNADRFIHACDYDQEGELIGYNILQYACNNKYESSLRAKFSTFTEDEIRYSFDNLLRPDKRLAEAAKCRHMIDFMYGINLSRALTQSYKISNYGKGYFNLTIGRVQGPTLAFVIDKESDIRKHIPVPYWTISGEFQGKNGSIIKTHYYPQQISTLAKATSIVDTCTNQHGKITDIKHENVTVLAPHPFNLGDLQKEAYRIFKFSPSYTLTVAEKLYIDALISYPRTSSQKLPESINYRRILSGISVIDSFSSFFVDVPNTQGRNSEATSKHPYAKLAANLLSKAYLSPNEGGKTDPAHPAIFPTGEKLKRRRREVAELKLFDLIVKRFLATFGDPQIRQHTTVTILVNDRYTFKVDGEKMISEGWVYFYKPYGGSSGPKTQPALDELSKGEILKNIIITIDEKFIQPPFRFNQASLLEKMEKENIGTKATRSEIINTLFKRNYITSTIVPLCQQENKNSLENRPGIEATDIGFEIVHSMRKYMPNVVSTDLTRSIEEQLESIESGRALSPPLIRYAIDKLKQATLHFKENEVEIGRRITDAVIITKNKQQMLLGTCPVCSEGDLKIITSSVTKKRFVGCSNYGAGICNATAPLPQKGTIKITGKVCSICRWPILKYVSSGQARHHWTFCINMKCSSKRHKI